jgi:DNA replication and repair protein RecF
MAILAVKLAEREFVEADQPLLLLDDIFSELDHENRDEVLKLLPHQQTIVTTTDEHSVPTRYRKNVAILRL